MSLGHVALDGTKVQANASKPKAMSHERMLKSEKQLEAEMRALLRKAEIIDDQEDGQFGKDKRGDELPKEPQRRESRLKWIRKAKAELEQEAAAARARENKEQAEMAEQEAAGAEASGAPRPASGRYAAPVVPASEPMTARSWPLRRQKPQDLNHQPPPQTAIPWRCHSASSPPTGLATPSPPPREISPTPTATSSKVVTAGFRATTARPPVDGDHQVIVAIGVSNQASDAVHLLPMLGRIEANTGRLPTALIADAGYCSTANLVACERRG